MSDVYQCPRCNITSTTTAYCGFCREQMLKREAGAKAQGLALDPILKTWIASIPCPYYCWQFWKWQKVQCQCGQTFISRDLGLIPRDYETHFALNHV